MKSQLSEPILKPKIANIDPFNVGRKGHSSKKRNLSSDEIKKRILIKLYEKHEGLNKNKIRALPTLNAVDSSALGAILAELCVVGKLNADSTSDYNEGVWIYTITDEGREFLERWKKMRGLGTGFSFFNGND